VRSALAAASRTLLNERNDEGHWVGELSSSALSTATGTFALHLFGDEADAPLVRRGLDWIAGHQNADGGWGDTVRSRSNLSTTVLCWSALSAASGGDEAHDRTAADAEQYIASAIGSTEPAPLAEAVAGRYGEDRTFSAPILTMCALAGRLGADRRAWSHVAQLPFELSACPHGLLKAVRLPVVSYALPALIAVGLVRHRRRPTRNPMMRIVRRLVRGRALRLLGQIQPPSGGFLEAAPLTSFVLMSLAAVGRGDVGPARRAAEFLRSTVRCDGAWPIDTNLATWVTTLSVGALGMSGTPPRGLDAPGRWAIREWLLAQQGQVEHPYTRAEPGGWAWTDLSGGVPDADDTAGALRALRALGPLDDRVRQAAAAGCNWLLDIQNKDGGVPTFCRGWGRLPFDRSCQDLTAHALIAWSLWHRDLPARLRFRAAEAISAGLAYLESVQGADGQWTPLWFGNEASDGQENPVYGTARVLVALDEVGRRRTVPLVEPFHRAVRYLLDTRGADGGWGGAPGVGPSIEETALAVDALSRYLSPGFADEASLPPRAVRQAVCDGVVWLIERTNGGRDFPAAPIGLYFAKLWYYEKLYPLIFTVAALSRAVASLLPRPSTA